MAIITERTGDIFAAPPHSILLHACNTKGAWGAGVALAFKKKYPQAYAAYRTHCLDPPPTTTAPSTPTPLHTHQSTHLPGTALLIPPPTTISPENTHYIACLFTSPSHGRNVSPPATILANTRAALADLEAQIRALKQRGERMGEVWAVRINSGMFGVEWAATRGVLESGGVDMVVLRREGEGEGGGKGETKRKRGGSGGVVVPPAGGRKRKRE